MQGSGEASIAQAAPERRGYAVMQVVPALEAGGAERTTVEIALALVRAGYRAIVASEGGPMVREVERAGATHVTLPLTSKNPFVIRRNADLLAKAARETGTRLMHVRSRAPAWSVRRAARLVGVPWVSTFHGIYEHKSFLKRRYNSVMLAADMVIANSAFTAKHIHDVYGVGANRVSTIPRGIDLDRFDPDRVSAERVIALAQSWRLPDGVPVALLPARMVEGKGQATFVEALSLIPRGEVIGLILAPAGGSPRFRQRLLALAEARGLGGYLRLIDGCRDMAAAYMLADVVVSPSIYPESFGRVVAEAQAMGRPVIASDNGAAGEILRAGETGWLTPPGDARALAAVIQSAVRLDPETRAAVAQAAHAHIAAHFDLETMCARTLHLYAGLMTV